MTTIQTALDTNELLPDRLTVPNGWRRVQLGDVLTLQRGYDLPERNRIDGNIPIVSSSGVCGCHKIAKSSAPGVVIGRYGTLGKAHYIEEDFWPLNTTLFVSNFKGTFPRFAYYLLQQLDYTPFSDKTGVPGVNRNHLHDVRIFMPPLKEQARIVEILDAADAVVRAMETLIAAKLRHKHALAELLLRGKRRFSEFAGQAWREVEVGSILKEVERPVEWDDSMFYNLVSVKRRSEGLFFRGATQGKTILTKKMKTIHTGDFLISKMQVVHGAWSKVPAQFDGYHASDSYITLVQSPDAVLDMDFFNYLSQLPQTYRLALVSSYGVHIEKMTFNLTLFLREKVTIPPTVEEQRCIAETLSLADEEIRLLRQQLERQRQIKHGLMEQLLLGRVRVREATP